jgi:cytochrome c-type biogenesis protein CcmH
MCDPDVQGKDAQQMGFWIATAGFAALVILVVLLAALRPQRAATPAAAYDLQVYRDQLREVARDVARGVLTEEEAARIRAEVSRRLLEADRALQASQTPARGTGRADRLILAVLLVASVAGSFALYLRIGAPGYPDLPLAMRVAQVETARASRPDQDSAEAQVPFRETVPADPRREALVIQLREVMARRPDDPQGMALLAQNEAALGNFRAAHLAQARLIDLLGEGVSGTEHIDLAEMMILAAGGYVSPEAEAALLRGLELAPRNGTARYYVGLMYAQQGRPDLAFPIWRNLLAESTAEAPWLDAIRLQIEEVAFLAGVNVTLAELPQPAAPRGPSAADIAAAQDMSAEDQGAMIAAMVAGLAARLASDGGPPEDWARLIGAQIVLGRTEEAMAIAEEARVTFADLPAALALIEAAIAPLAARAP